MTRSRPALRPRESRKRVQSALVDVVVALVVVSLVAGALTGLLVSEVLSKLVVPLVPWAPCWRLLPPPLVEDCLAHLRDSDVAALVALPPTTIVFSGACFLVYGHRSLLLPSTDLAYAEESRG